jgi:hypothetical protein
VPGAVFDRIRCLRGGNPLGERFPDALTIIGMDILPRQVTESLLGGVPEDALERGTLVPEPSVGVENRNDVCGLLDECLKPLFALSGAGDIRVNRVPVDVVVVGQGDIPEQKIPHPIGGLAAEDFVQRLASLDAVVDAAGLPAAVRWDDEVVDVLADDLVGIVPEHVGKRFVDELHVWFVALVDVPRRRFGEVLEKRIETPVLSLEFTLALA